MFIVRMSYVELYNNRFRNLLEGGGARDAGSGSDGGEGVGFGSSVGSGRGSWREAADAEVSSSVTCSWSRWVLYLLFWGRGLSCSRRLGA